MASPVVLTTVAMAGFEEVQVDTALMFPLFPFPYVPVAVSCSLVPAAIEALGTVTTRETRLPIWPPPVMGTTRAGIPAAVTVRVPAVVPTTAGVKTTVTTQEPLAAIVAPQVLPVMA